MTRASTAAAVGAIILGAVAVLAQSASPELIQVDVVVEDARGQPVEGLTDSDFEIESDGVRRPVVSSAMGTPVSVLTIFDRSVSTSRSDPTVDPTLDELVEWLSFRVSSSMRIRPAGAANRLRLSPAFTADGRSLRASVAMSLTFRGLDRAGPSPLVDVMDDAVRSFASVAGRRAVVLISDGRSTGNSSAAADVARRAAIAGVTVNVFILLPLPRRDGVRAEYLPAVEARTALHPSVLWQPFAEGTGGTCIVFSDFRDRGLELTLGQVFQSLERTYTLGFSPSMRDGEFHALTVRVTRRGLRVRAPSGYVARGSHEGTDYPGAASANVVRP